MKRSANSSDEAPPTPDPSPPLAALAGGGERHRRCNFSFVWMKPCPGSISARLAARSSTAYPKEFEQVIAGREKTGLGNAVGLTQFGVNLARLKAGAQSSQRHWHERRTNSSTCSKARWCCRGRGRDRAQAGDCRGLARPAAPTAIAWSTAPTATPLSRNRHALETERVHYPDIDHDGPRRRTACASCTIGRAIR